MERFKLWTTKEKAQLKIKKLEIACKKVEDYYRKVIEIYNIPSLLKGKGYLFNKFFQKGMASSSLVGSSAMFSNQDQDYDNQPRDKDEYDEENFRVV